ncbi:sorting nexin-22 isoform X2 [Suricata suricatta]|uniref:Sorting nexin 22 n=1 Tax=Suricata suricatta TaxID=37032 RepID=A0A673UIW8_SURSU|nr:sorting nexin-22 isoform X2 [Suricata suricatta]
MLEVHIPSVGPEAEDPRQSPEKGHMVFRVEVLCRGRRHVVQRRYSEFHALHKRVRLSRRLTDPGLVPAHRLGDELRPRPLPPLLPPHSLEGSCSGHRLRCGIKKLYKVPDFPSKRLPNWRTRGLEQRRQGLEAYIQGVLYLNQDVPKELLEFLCLRHFSTDPKAGSWGSQLHHRPVISFCMDPYICIPSPEPLSNMVVNGVLQGLYGFSTSSAKAQPEAPCHSAPLPPMP